MHGQTEIIRKHVCFSTFAETSLFCANSNYRAKCAFFCRFKNLVVLCKLKMCAFLATGCSARTRVATAHFVAIFNRLQTACSTACSARGSLTTLKTKTTFDILKREILLITYISFYIFAFASSFGSIQQNHARCRLCCRLSAAC